MKQSRLKTVLIFILLLVITIMMNIPIVMVFPNSLRPTSAILTEPGFLPRQPSLINYEHVTQETTFWRWFRNSIIVAGGGTLLGIFAASPAGYSLPRFRRPLLTLYSNGLLMLQMFPIILALIPLFILFRYLKLINHFLAPILIYSVVQLPFATWMFKSFFDAIPGDLEEAALIDGCSRLGAFLRVVLPLTGPAFAAVTIFTFLFAYNEFLIANIFLRRDDLMTVPVGIQTFIQQYGAEWGSMMAAATLAIIPSLVLFMFVERYMIQVAIGSAVKG